MVATGKTDVCPPPEDAQSPLSTFSRIQDSCGKSKPSAESKAKSKKKHLKKLSESVLDSAKMVAQCDKMKVNLTNVSKDTNKKVKKLYKSATAAIDEEGFEEESSGLLKAILEKEKKKNNEGDSDDEYEVQEILDKRELEDKIEYLVKWRGWDDIDDRTWEPEEHLEGAEKLIIAYKKLQDLDENLVPRKHGKKVKLVVEDDFEVEDILEKRGKGKKVEYLVRWRTKPDDVEDETWELLEDLSDFSDIIELFEKNLEENTTKSTTENAGADEPTTSQKRQAESSDSDSVSQPKKQKTSDADDISLTTKSDCENKTNSINTPTKEHSDVGGKDTENLINAAKANFEKVSMCDLNSFVEGIIKASIEDAINIIFDKQLENKNGEDLVNGNVIQGTENPSS